jgi:ribosomal protein S18 acetylase RimI-like enzyme
MRLDTLPSMAAAAALYGKFGFAQIPAYYANPIPGTLYFSRRLAGSG